VIPLSESLGGCARRRDDAARLRRVLIPTLSAQEISSTLHASLTALLTLTSQVCHPVCSSRTDDIHESTATLSTPSRAAPSARPSALYPHSPPLALSEKLSCSTVDGSGTLDKAESKP
jgi:hypothetical protein